MIILKVSFKLLLFWNSINNANPLFANNPVMVFPNERILFKYSSLIIILDAQFGIKPTKPIINGVYQTLWLTKLLMFSIFI